jgi:hypothetical protein
MPLLYRILMRLAVVALVLGLLKHSCRIRVPARFPIRPSRPVRPRLLPHRLLNPRLPVEQ